jgi:DNA helicase-2/ATP-dependent DNA helicase PcrA
MEHLKGLNQAQKQAVEHVDGPLLIVAGAGAGKTKTITHRMIHAVCQGIPASRILGVTFTNKAAREMHDRVRALLALEMPHSWEEPSIATFHSLSVRLLREFGPRIGVPRGFAIWDRDDSLRAIKAALKEEGGDVEPRKVLAAISRGKSDGQGHAAYAAEAATYQDRTIARLWSRYEAEARAHDALDFDDLLVKAFELLKDQEVRPALDARYSHITIDEYQDTNAIQYEIARLLAGERMNICAVGDLDQCIYTWRQAKLENLLSFEKSFPGTTVVTLEENYRSTQTILAAANAIIEKNVNRLPKRLFTQNGTGDAITLAGLADEADEARYVAQSVRELLAGGIAAQEIAVLFRENFQSRALEEAFIRTNLPYRVLGVRFFERAEIKDVLSYLRASLNRKSTIDIARAAGAPPRGIGKQTLERLQAGGVNSLTGAAQAKARTFLSLLDRILAAIESQKPSDTVLFIINESGLRTKLLQGDAEDRERLSNIEELASLAVQYDALPPREGIERLLEEASLMSDQDSYDAAEGAVSLMTVHASKGLEFDTVYVTGLEQGLFPSLRGDERDPEEERRLFYVAMTRAKRKLFLTYARSRLKYGTRDYALPSEFLEDIDRRLIDEDLAFGVSRPRRGGSILDMYEDEDTIR